MKIVNNGPQTARNFTITDTIPNFIHFLSKENIKMSMEPAVLDITPQTIRWQFDELLPAKSLEISYAMQVRGKIPANPYVLINKTYISAKDDTNPLNNIAIADTVYIIGEQAAEILAENSNNQKHIVQCGEYLSLLSRIYYGDAGNYPAIYEANKALIGENPDKIFPGQEIVIPGTGERSCAGSALE